jgi:hypothetical protein
MNQRLQNAAAVAHSASSHIEQKYQQGQLEEGSSWWCSWLRHCVTSRKVMNSGLPKEFLFVINIINF